MTSTDDNDKNRGQAGEPAVQPRATTYEQAQSSYRSTLDADERFGELTSRDLTASSIAGLKAHGLYDPVRHPHPGKYPPLTTEEHLEILAAGEMLARYYRHPVYVRDAVTAGASWEQVAAATGVDEAQARQRYREWAGGQHRLHAYYGGTLGMKDAEYAAAITRAVEPDRRTASRLAENRSGTPEPDTGNVAAVSADEKRLILAALDEAADNKRDRAANCGDCADQSCGACQYRLQVADAYDHLAARLLGPREPSMPATPDRPLDPDTGTHRQADVEPEAVADPEAGR